MAFIICTATAFATSRAPRSARGRERPFALNLWIPFENSEHPQVSDAEFDRAVDVLSRYFDELNVPRPKRPVRFTPPYPEQVEAVLEARPSVFSFVFGIPEPAILARCRELGITTFGTVTTVDEAIAMERAGVDVVVASGCEAGGHRISFLQPAQGPSAHRHASPCPSGRRCSGQSYRRRRRYC